MQVVCISLALFLSFLTWLRHLFVPFRLESCLKMCQSDSMKIKGLRSYLWCGVVCYGAILPEHLVIHVSTGVFAGKLHRAGMCRLAVMY